MPIAFDFASSAAHRDQRKRIRSVRLTVAHDFETLVRGAEQPACPACQSHDIERLLSSFGVSSEARAHSTLQAARRDFTHSTDRKDRIRHEAEQVRDHVQEDYGILVPKVED